jgi:hypothetical protein
MMGSFPHCLLGKLGLRNASKFAMPLTRSLDRVPVAFFLTFSYSRNESVLYRYLILITSPVLAVLLILSVATVLTVVSHCSEVFLWRETSRRAYMAPDRARVFC